MTTGTTDTTKPAQAKHGGSTRFIIELATPNRPDAQGRTPTDRLKAALKVLSRRHDLRCTHIGTNTEATE